MRGGGGTRRLRALRPSAAAYRPRRGGSGGSGRRRGRHDRRLGLGLRPDGRRRARCRAGAGPGRDGRQLASGGHRSRPGRNARDGRPRPLVDRLLSPPAASCIGTDSGFRELGYLLLAITAEDERVGRARVAMQQAQGLAVRWVGAAEAAALNPTLATGRPPRRQLPRQRRAHRPAAQRARLLAGHGGSRRRAPRTDGVHRARHGAAWRRSSG